MLFTIWKSSSTEPNVTPLRHAPDTAEFRRKGSPSAVCPEFDANLIKYMMSR